MTDSSLAGNRGDPRSLIGMELPGFTTEVDRDPLREFATAIGETDPVYLDVAAAHAAGHRDLLVPPTYLFSLEFQRPDPYLVLRALGVDLSHVLHGEQRSPIIGSPAPATN